MEEESQGNDQVKVFEDLTWAGLCLKREAGDRGQEVEADGKYERK